MQNASMKFSWSAFILAPLAVPALYSAVLTSSTVSKSPFLGFLFIFALGSVFSYCTTLFLFLPSLYLLSRFAALTRTLACASGTLIGVVAFIPVAWVSYRSSGANSGPPKGAFADSFWRDLSEPITLVFPVAGLVTAALYWLVLTGSSRRRAGTHAADAERQGSAVPDSAGAASHGKPQ